VQEVVGGFVIMPEYANQLHFVFSRIVFALRLRFQRRPSSRTSTSSDTSDSPECSIQQWMNGAKVRVGRRGRAALEPTIQQAHTHTPA